MPTPKMFSYKGALYQFAPDQMLLIKMSRKAKPSPGQLNLFDEGLHPRAKDGKFTHKSEAPRLPVIEPEVEPKDLLADLDTFEPIEVAQMIQPFPTDEGIWEQVLDRPLTDLEEAFLLYGPPYTHKELVYEMRNALTRDRPSIIAAGNKAFAGANDKSIQGHDSRNNAMLDLDVHLSLQVLDLSSFAVKELLPKLGDFLKAMENDYTLGDEPVAEFFPVARNILARIVPLSELLPASIEISELSPKDSNALTQLQQATRSGLESCSHPICRAFLEPLDTYFSLSLENLEEITRIQKVNKTLTKQQKRKKRKPKA